MATQPRGRAGGADSDGPAGSEAGGVSHRHPFDARDLDRLRPPVPADTPNARIGLFSRRPPIRTVSRRNRTQVTETLGLSAENRRPSRAPPRTAPNRSNRLEITLQMGSPPPIDRS
jgi:hypothetical protein